MKGLKAALFPFKEQVSKTYKNCKPRIFASILDNHGECQVRLASGEIHSLHAGDSGLLSEDEVIYTDREGQYVALFWDQVEAVWFHIGYKD